MVIIGVCLQVLREECISYRAREVEAEAARVQQEYQQKQDALNEKQEAIAQTQAELNKLQRTSNKRQKELEKVLKTMPPAHTLSNLVEKYRYIHFWLRNRQPVDSGASPETIRAARDDLDEMFRLSLHSIANLYIDYDHLPVGTKCSANFATFIPMGELTLEKNKGLKDYVAERIRFVEHPNDPLFGLEGVLQFTPQLSAFAKDRMDDGHRYAQDPNFSEEFFLPVPIEDDMENGHYKSLPIAPLAYRVGLVNVPDIRSRLSRKALRSLNVNRRVIDEVTEFLRKDEYGRLGSGLGIRLLLDDLIDDLGKDKDPANLLVLGVITIVTESPANLEGRALQSYIDLIRPILELQKDLLSARMELWE